MSVRQTSGWVRGSAERSLENMLLFQFCQASWEGISSRSSLPAFPERNTSPSPPLHSFSLLYCIHSLYRSLTLHTSLTDSLVLFSISVWVEALCQTHVGSAHGEHSMDVYERQEGRCQSWLHGAETLDRGVGTMESRTPTSTRTTRKESTTCLLQGPLGGFLYLYRGTVPQGCKGRYTDPVERFKSSLSRLQRGLQTSQDHFNKAIPPWENMRHGAAVSPEFCINYFLA